MKGKTTVTDVLEHPWSLVASLFWKRYPNPQSKHVLAEDVLEREILANGQLYTKRIIIKASLSSIPRWIRYFTGSKKEVIIEESLLDTENNSIETMTRNVGSLTRYAILFERCLYTPTTVNSSDALATVAPQQPPAASLASSNIPSLPTTTITKLAWVESDWKSRMLGPLSSYLIYAYSRRAQYATKGYDWVCRTALELKTSDIAIAVRLAERIRSSASVMKGRAQLAKNMAKNRMLVRASSRST